MESNQHNPNNLKLFMMLLGSKAPGRHVEQHDFFFGIASSLKELVPDIKKFWPEAGEKIHIDGWREVNEVDGYKVSFQLRDGSPENSQEKLFFINLGGYQENKFEEQHYVLLTVKPDRAAAFNEAKDTYFFKHNGFKGANSHIDDKYGVDVDELYEIDEVLTPSQKQKYKIQLTKDTTVKPDKLNLGYFKLSNLLLVIALLFTSNAFAQSQNDIDFFAGKWEIMIKGTQSGDATVILVLDKGGDGLIGSVQDTNGAELSKVARVVVGPEKLNLQFVIQGQNVNVELTKKDDSHVTVRYGGYAAEGQRVY